MKSGYKNHAQKYVRKDRRRAILMIIIGVLFTASGVFIWFTDSAWLALTSIAFGLAVVLGGMLTWSQSDGSMGSSKVLIATCLMFVVLSGLMVINATVSPEDFDGIRGPRYALIGGYLGLAFFGPGLIFLVVRQISKGRSRSSTSHDTESDEIR